MRLPLLVAARPKYSIGGPRVPLGEGKWCIVVERVKDTTLIVSVDDVPLPSPLANDHIIQGPCFVVVGFDYRGCEEYINVFAEEAA